MRLSGRKAAATPDDLLDDRALERLFWSLRPASAILVAVSGGPDSMALLHLLARWRQEGGGPPLLAATVDHGLRPEAKEEAALAEQAARDLGIPHRTIPWTGPKPEAGVQEAAREARYALLAAAARDRGASHLATAHTQDDQAETILMRLAAGSGPAGLAGMRPQVERRGVLHVRPLLDVQKGVLVELCRREGWRFAEDPSNADPRFARARWRQILPLLAQEGLTPARLSRLAERMLRAEDALDRKAREALKRARASDDNLMIEGRALAEEPFEIAVRMVSLALTEVAGAGTPVRLERVESAVQRLREAVAAGRPLRLTLAGALISLDRRGLLHLALEPPRRRGRYPFGSVSAAAPPHSLGKGEGRA